MAEPPLVNGVRPTGSELVGRRRNAVGPHHLVLDRPGLGEALTTADAFLAGVSPRGVTLVERAARDAGVPLRRVEVAIGGVRDRHAPAAFARIALRFAPTGPTQEGAEALVGRHQDT
ncbi:MAG TPA: hypothetical protein VFL91_15520 [Thermomicrobiales bacterium]|nr:hypothetical protein [Thermomicrobiales bacterium]